MEIFVYFSAKLLLSKIRRRNWIRKRDQQQHFHSGGETSNKNFISRNFQVFLKLQNFLGTHPILY